MSSNIPDSKDWNPPAKIEDLFAASEGNKFASINSPVAGARSEKDLSIGPASVQLYSLATPNGHKVGILFEELGIDYDAHVINIMAGDQFTSGFVGVNPNSKIPTAVDLSGPNGQQVNLFESGSIVLYFAEKFNKFIPSDPSKRAECLNWVFWQMGGQGPMTGNFGHFMVYAPPDKLETRDYGVARYGMEVQRLCSVLDKHLEGKTFMVNEEYTIADIICFPWFHQLKVGYKHASGATAASVLSVEQYKNAVAWADRISERPAVKRGLLVCSGGFGKPWLEKPVEEK